MAVKTIPAKVKNQASNMGAIAGTDL